MTCRNSVYYTFTHRDQVVAKKALIRHFWAGASQLSAKALAYRAHRLLSIRTLSTQVFPRKKTLSCLLQAKNIFLPEGKIMPKITFVGGIYIK